MNAFRWVTMVTSLLGACALDTSVAQPEALRGASSSATSRCEGPPGLYVDGSCSDLAPGVRSFAPEYELWSDDAEKDRFVYLPPATAIDTADPNRWTFPIGTRLYKTFSQEGVRLETRILTKVAAAPGIASWSTVAYAWSADQRSVQLADPLLGASDVLGTDHDIPTQAQCRTCHTVGNSDVPLGFQAIQLNHAHTGYSLQDLLRENRLTNSASIQANVTRQNARIPGNAKDREALGYLHANCGHCHGGPTPRAGLALWTTVGSNDVVSTPTWQTAVNRCLTRWIGNTAPDGSSIALRIAAGDSEHSGLLSRMSARGTRDQMPPLGTEFVDPGGLSAVSDWIERIAREAGAAAACPTTP